MSLLKVSVIPGAIFLVACGVSDAHLSEPAISPAPSILRGEPRSDLGPADCADGAVYRERIFREGFRDRPADEPGKHRFWVLAVCEKLTNRVPSEEAPGASYRESYRLLGVLTSGIEADIHRGETHVVPESSVTVAFQGVYELQKYMTHGDASEIESDDGRFRAQGNFSYNRNVYVTQAGDTRYAPMTLTNGLAN